MFFKEIIDLDKIDSPFFRQSKDKRAQATSNYPRVWFSDKVFCHNIDQYFPWVFLSFLFITASYV